MERFAGIATEALNSVLQQKIKMTDLEIPPDSSLGDFAFPCFKLAKEYRKAPPALAQQLVDEINTNKTVEGRMLVRAVGPYVNFTVPPQEALKLLLKDILSKDTLLKEPGELALTSYGSCPAGSRGSWVVEFSSPNVAKPLNIYHLRTTALGAVLARVGRYRGYQVTTINHLGDWGKQYGMLTVAFRHFGKTVDSDLTMMDLVDLYVRINGVAETNPEILEQAKQAFVLLEQGDPAITALWKKCVEISIDAFNKSYARLNISFDHFWGESFYKDQLAPLISDLKQKGTLVESEGAWVVPVEDENGNELPPCILQKSDGATIYATRDLAAAIYRFDKFHFDRMTYIVGGEQRLHFKQLFAVLKKLGLSWSTRCEHVPTGLYRFKDAKMSTRKGNFVTLDDVLELAKERVISLMSTRPSSAQIPASEIHTIAEAIAVGAVVFHDLHTDPSRDVDFDIERVVDFEGETGPYLQYAHTRCLSILRKAIETGQFKPASPDGTVPYSESGVALLQAPQEVALVKTLGQFPLHLERTLTFSKASQLAHYLIDVTKAFGSFYRECQVLNNTPELTQARLMLVESTRRILGMGLELLGVPRPERM